MKKIPVALIYSRILLGLAIVPIAYYRITHFRTIIIGLILLGLLTDIFDGIIARQLNVATDRLRRMDSNVDTFFWLAVAAACYIISPAFFKTNFIAICILIGLEVGCYAVSFIRFRKDVAVHALSSKLWALILFFTLTQVIATDHSVILFGITFYWGIISKLETIAILLLLKKWESDIPSVFHAIKIKNNKPIKRHKLFN
ncbi:CDP-alcohol phosphatidyltransferase family protein [uncultured Mucilaginibacter sp.]|uniref:CDP-alcohol phosphatidyltransferase family protein n=1 Tax=uncultured Mucilaginibacter sp. TaxID=797541 RepID=UPI0025D9C7B0|nr:CDP-alcohol phosphatidyltransferase family protein [uncultured Mucilaginibacter sp.]